MAIDPLTSISSLTPLGTAAAKKAAAAESAQFSGSPDFASVLSALASQTASTIRSSEDTAIQGIQGQVAMQDVVQSVMKAETSLQAALALRDKAVTAYQDLTKMAI